MMPELHLVIIAAGKGTRFGEQIPKQFTDLKGEPLLFYTFKAFSGVKDLRFTLVLDNDYVEFWNELCKKHGFSVPHKIVAGGETRFQSVKNGLRTISDDSYVMIHDGVRPFPSKDTINNVINAALAEGNGVPAVEINEAVRIISGSESKPVDRQSVRIVQTPQAYFAADLKSAYNVDYHADFIDEATVFESAGNKINLVKGNSENIKITYQNDMIFAEKMV